MAKFYTEVNILGNTIFVRGYDNGKRVQRRVDYKPYLFVSTKNEVAEYRSLDGHKADRIDFENIKEAKEFIKSYSDVEGMTIYGLTSYLYAYLNDEYPGQVQYDLDMIRKLGLDIECAPEEGEVHSFPDIQLANQPITAITCSLKGKKMTFGLKPYKVSDPSVTYKKCADERQLLLEFIGYWESVDPDIVTGWNIEFFDVPYIINRIKRILGDVFAKRLSPWRMLEEKMIDIQGKEQQTFRPMGVSVLDYLRVYKQFTYVTQESYKLENIAYVELGEHKLDHSEHANLTEFYRNDPQKYIDYNIHDVRLIDMLEEKLGLLDLGLTLSYDAKITYDDMFTSIRLWDIIIHNYLLDQKIVIPMPTGYKKDEKFEGAYVREPRIGMHKWVATFDVNSLYPSLIVQNNMSPETFRGKVKMPDVDDLLKGNIDERLFNKLVDVDYALSANGALWDKTQQGFFPKLVLKMYAERKAYQAKLKEAKQQGTKDVSRYHNLQLVKKIVLNSLFGATGHPAFRYYQNDYAEGITIHGKLAIQWVAQDIDAYLNKILKTEGKQFVVYCDTDSVFVTLDDVVGMTGLDDTKKIVEFVNSFCEDKLEKVIEKSFENLKEFTNSYVNQMKMKRENIADTAIFLSKKKYIMNVWDSEGFRYDEPKLYIKGVEAVRSSTPAACREKLKESMKIIMLGVNQKLIDYIDDFRSKFKKMSYEEIAFPRGVNGIAKYTGGVQKLYKDGCPIHVRGTIVYNDLIKKNKLERNYPTIKEGEKIKFCYMKKPNIFHEDIISSPGDLPHELNLHRFIDYDTQFDKAFLAPIKNITDAIGWKTENIATLESFFDE